MTEPTPDAVNALADRFWEAILELNPTTATMYGDERYADRLEDPSEAGREKALALWRSTRREADAIPTDGLAVEDRITLDMIQVVCDLGVEEHDQRIDRPPGRRPDGRPADAAPGDRPVPEGRHARAPRDVRGPAAGLPGLHGGHAPTCSARDSPAA